MELPAVTDPNYIRMLTIQKDASVAMIGSGLKADENRFRKRKNDILKNLFERIEAKQGGTLLEHTPIVN